MKKLFTIFIILNFFSLQICFGSFFSNLKKFIPKIPRLNSHSVQQITPIPTTQAWLVEPVTQVVERPPVAYAQVASRPMTLVPSQTAERRVHSSDPIASSQPVQPRLSRVAPPTTPLVRQPVNSGGSRVSAPQLIKVIRPSARNPDPILVFNKETSREHLIEIAQMRGLTPVFTDGTDPWIKRHGLYEFALMKREKTDKTWQHIVLARTLSK